VQKTEEGVRSNKNLAVLKTLGSGAEKKLPTIAQVNPHSRRGEEKTALGEINFDKCKKAQKDLRPPHRKDEENGDIMMGD